MHLSAAVLNSNVPVTSATAPTITIINLRTNTAVVSAQNMTQAATGSEIWFYNFIPAAGQLLDNFAVAIDCDPGAAGQVTAAERYKYASFRGTDDIIEWLDAVWIDTVNGSAAGTGTQLDPIDTLANGKARADILGLKAYKLVAGSTIAITAGHDGWRIEGVGNTPPIVDLNDQAIDVELFRVQTTGDLAATSDSIYAKECLIDDIAEVPAGSTFVECGFKGSFDTRDTQTPSGTAIRMINCFTWGGALTIPATLTTTPISESEDDWSAKPAWLTEAGDGVFAYSGPAGDVTLTSVGGSLGEYIDADTWTRLEIAAPPVPLTVSVEAILVSENLRAIGDDLSAGLFIEDRERQDLYIAGVDTDFDTDEFIRMVEHTKQPNSGDDTKLGQVHSESTTIAGAKIRMSYDVLADSHELYINDVLENTAGLDNAGDKFVPGYLGLCLLGYQGGGDGTEAVVFDELVITATGYASEHGVVPIEMTRFSGDVNLDQAFPAPSKLDIYGKVTIGTNVVGTGVRVTGQGELDASNQYNPDAVGPEYGAVDGGGFVGDAWRRQVDLADMDAGSWGQAGILARYMGPRGPGIWMSLDTDRASQSAVPGIDGTFDNPIDASFGELSEDRFVKLAVALGIRRLYFYSSGQRANTTFSVNSSVSEIQDWIEWEFIGVIPGWAIGSNNGSPQITFHGGGVFKNCRFENLGVLELNTVAEDELSEGNVWINCGISGSATNQFPPPGSTFINCQIENDRLTLNSRLSTVAQPLRLINCWRAAEEADNPLEIRPDDYYGNPAISNSFRYTPVEIINYKGDIEITDGNGIGSDFRDSLIDIQGNVILDANIANGDFVITGKGQLTDNTESPVTVDSSRFDQSTQAAFDALVATADQIDTNVQEVQGDTDEILGHVGLNKVVEVLERDARGNPTQQRTRLYDSGTNAELNDGSTGLIRELPEIDATFTQVEVDGVQRDVMETFKSKSTVPLALESAAGDDFVINATATLRGAATAFSESAFFSGAAGTTPADDGDTWLDLYEPNTTSARNNGSSDILLQHNGNQTRYEDDNEILVYHTLPAGLLGSGAYVRAPYTGSGSPAPKDISGDSGVWTGVFFEDEVNGVIVTFGWGQGNDFYGRAWNKSGQETNLDTSRANIISALADVNNQDAYIYWRGKNESDQPQFGFRLENDTEVIVPITSATWPFDVPTRCGCFYMDSGTSPAADPADGIEFTQMEVAYTIFEP